MNVKQIAELTNLAFKEATGREDLTTEDLSNIVDLGTAVFNANALDNYVRALVDKIGKTIFVSRAYSGNAPKVLMDAWEWGSVVEKVRMQIPEATENPTWKLEDGETYDQDKFTQPKIKVKFFNSKTTFEVPISITEIQAKEAFTSASSMTGFIEMIYNTMEISMNKRFDELILRVIANAIGETIASDYGEDALNSKSGIKAVNILKLYNDEFGTTLTADKAFRDKEFLRYSSTIIKEYIKRMEKLSTLFNVSGVEKFTPRDLLHVDLFSEYVSKVSAYLESDTFHNELVALPNYEEIAYWQGTGKEYKDAGKLKITTASGKQVEVTGKILGVLFDRDALGVYNYNKRVPSHRNDHAEFWNLWYKQDASYFNDLDENCVVFFIQ